MMLVLPNQRLSWKFSNSDEYSAFSQPVWYRPHTQIRIVPFSRLTNKTLPIWNFSQPYFNRTFSNCRSHNSPAKGWPYRFRSRGTTGSFIVDHDFGLCVSVDVSKYLDFLTLGIFNNCGASSILLGISRYCIRCLSCAPWQTGYDIHDFCCCHLRCWWSLFREFCIRVRIIFYNITSEYNSTFVFWMFWFQLKFFEITEIHWHSSAAMPVSFEVFPIIYRLLLLNLVFSLLEA